MLLPLGVLPVVHLAAQQAPARDNALLQPSPLPYGAPPFDRIASADFRAAFDLRMKEELAEVQQIAAAPQPPTFANTIEAAFVSFYCFVD